MLNFFLGISLVLTADAKITIEDPNEPAKPTMKQVLQVETAAIRYRVQVYQTFRQNRAEFDARQAAGRETLRHWSMAGKPTGYANEVAAWFDSARAASSYPQISAIPGPIDLPSDSFVTSEEDSVASPSDAGPSLGDVKAVLPETQMDKNASVSETKEPLTKSKPAAKIQPAAKAQTTKPEITKPEMNEPEIKKPAATKEKLQPKAGDDSVEPDLEFDDKEFLIPVNDTTDDATVSKKARDYKESKVLGVIGRSIYKALPGTE